MARGFGAVLAHSAAVVVLTIGAWGCTPGIGDSCKLSTDCSALGDRLCDTSQPDGYCTVFNCDPGGCPSEASCVEFHPTSERFSRRFCVRHCDSPSDCRAGYVCIDPAARDGRVIDNP